MSHNKYADLQALHQQLRATKPALQNAGPKDGAAPQNVVPSSGGKLPVQSVVQDGNKPKSSAQVETFVVQPAVLQKSCALSSPKTSNPPPLSVRFTYDDLLVLRQNAKAVGISVSEYVRQASLGSHYTPPHDPDLADALRSTLVELTRHGTNLNQIAKHLNVGSQTPDQAEGVLSIIYPAYLRTLSKVRKALARGTEEPIP